MLRAWLSQGYTVIVVPLIVIDECHLLVAVVWILFCSFALGRDNLHFTCAKVDPRTVHSGPPSADEVALAHGGK